jgi:hypothetical protein
MRALAGIGEVACGRWVSGGPGPGAPRAPLDRARPRPGRRHRPRPPGRDRSAAAAYVPGLATTSPVVPASGTASDSDSESEPTGSSTGIVELGEEV